MFPFHGEKYKLLLFRRGIESNDISMPSTSGVGLASKMTGTSSSDGVPCGKHVLLLQGKRILVSLIISCGRKKSLERE